MIGLIVISLLGLSGWVATGVSGIPPYQQFQEGPCQTTKEVEFLPVFNIRRQLVIECLPHISGGSKSTLYRLASKHPQSVLLKEEQLLQNLCPTRNVSSEQPGVATHFGFGHELLQTYFSRTRLELPGLYLELTPTDDHQVGGFHDDRDILRQYLTLTDNRNYAVIYNCWTETNQRGWMVISRRPRLDAQTRQIISNHVRTSLNFRNEANNVFIRTDHCPRVKSPSLPGEYLDWVIPSKNSLPRRRKTNGAGKYAMGIFANSLATISRPTGVVTAPDVIKVQRPLRRPASHGVIF